MIIKVRASTENKIKRLYTTKKKIQDSILRSFARINTGLYDCE